MPVVLSGTNGVTFPDSSLQAAAASPYVLKNRIINGAMVIDQRNAGASTTPTGAGGGTYTLDRWCYQAAQTGKATVQQNAGAVTPPTGFTNYAGITSTSAYSVLTGDYFHLYQAIEGFNIADLAWGTANAKTITISFWVRSSLTGTFGGSLRNSAVARSYPFTYTISVANTWELKSVTIAGDTSGTWLTTNGVGIYVGFGLGSGATYSGTANAWGAGNFVQPSSTVSVVGTNGATFYITGVQLEVGTSATPFERRLYNQELANCQRYYWKMVTGQNFNQLAFCSVQNSTTHKAFFVPNQQMRAIPTTLDWGGLGLITVWGAGVQGLTSIVYDSNLTGTNSFGVTVTPSSGLGSASAITMLLGNNNPSGYIGFGAEL